MVFLKYPLGFRDSPSQNQWISFGVTFRFFKKIQLNTEKMKLNVGFFNNSGIIGLGRMRQFGV